MISMHQILPLIVLLSGIHASAQERQLSSRASELTQALAALRTSPDDSGAQERYLKAFPHNYREFLHLFDLDHELYDGHDFIDALSLTGKDHAAELGELLVGLAKDAYHDADAPSYLQQVTAVYAGQHPKTFAELCKQLSPQKQTQLITFLADAEAHYSYPEYQAVIDGLKRIGEDKLAIRFEEARTRRERQPHHWSRDKAQLSLESQITSLALN
jgi:hypothetical protein